jgi:hypothetical protein
VRARRLSPLLPHQEVTARLRICLGPALSQVNGVGTSGAMLARHSEAMLARYSEAMLARHSEAVLARHSGAVLARPAFFAFFLCLNIGAAWTYLYCNSNGGTRQTSASEPQTSRCIARVKKKRAAGNQYILPSTDRLCCWLLALARRPRRAQLRCSPAALPPAAPGANARSQAPRQRQAGPPCIRPFGMNSIPAIHLLASCPSCAAPTWQKPIPYLARRNLLSIR